VLAHAVGPSATARLIAARTRRRQAGISAHRNRDGALLVVVQLDARHDG